MSLKVEVLINIASELGEGPMYHNDLEKLFWVDILQKKLHGINPDGKELITYSFDKMPGAAVPTKDKNVLLISFEDGLAFFNLESKHCHYIIKYHQGLPNMRANDGKCDPSGNFWLGTMSKTAEEKKGALYCFGHQGSFEKIFSDRSISNGLAWNINSKKMYYIDSADNGIKQYDYLKESRNILNEKKIIENPDLKYFDGMTIDTEGMLWVAHCTKSCVIRWNPETGEELLRIEFPVPKVTSLTFGGPDMNTLFISSALEHMSKEDRLKYPLSGSIFKIETPYKGIKTHIYQGKIRKVQL
jgi:sugar lactone lactonase YvrE